MVIEVLSKQGWGGLGFSLDFITKDFEKDFFDRSQISSVAKEGGARPWVILETSPASASSPHPRLYLPSLAPTLRQATASRLLLWLSCSEELAPRLAQTLLESSLCQGIFLRGLENFSRSQPAALWGRRWQLAAQKGGSHLLWLHEKRQAVIGFDLRLEWTVTGSFEIRKGHGQFPLVNPYDKNENDDRKEKLHRPGSAQFSAAGAA